jgi:hypothetical protein
MKLSSMDLHTLRHAADVADAQRDLVELMRRRSERAKRSSTLTVDPAVIVALAAIAVLSMLTLSSLA